MYYSLIFLLAMIGGIEGIATTNPGLEDATAVRSIDNSSSSRGHFKKSEATTETTATDAVDEGEERGFNFGSWFRTEKAAVKTLSEEDAAVLKKLKANRSTFIKRLKDVDIKGDIKGMVFAYAIFLTALVAILYIAHSIQLRNRATLN